MRRVRVLVAGAAAVLTTIGLLSVASPALATTYSEQQGHHGANTFTNYHNASGMGRRIDPAAWVQVSCKVYDPYIGTANPDGYWYRIASSPWNDQYYAAANTFMNGDPWNGPYTHNTDFAVPDCGSAPSPAPQPAPSPSVTLAQGSAAPHGYWYAISLSNFAASTSVSVSCYDSVSPSGFRTFPLTTNASGSASAAAGGCYSGDGPDHWVAAGGVQSNHVNWGSGGTTQPPTNNPGSGGNGGSAPPPNHSIINGIDVGVAQNQPHAWGTCTVQDFNGGPNGWVIVSYTGGTRIVRNGMLWGWFDNGGAPGFGCPVDDEHAVGAQQRQNFMTDALYWVTGMNHGRRLPTAFNHSSNATTSNWSGAVAMASNTQATLDGSTVSYRVPSVVCSPGETSTTAVWTGIGGAHAGGDDTLYQAGTSSQCVRGVAQYSPWFEIESNSNSMFNFHGGKPLPHSVAANDLMDITIRPILSKGRYVTQYTVIDRGPSNYWRQQFTLSYYSSKPATRSSECIVERPETSESPALYARLASFGEVQMTCGVYRGSSEAAIDSANVPWRLDLFGMMAPGSQLLTDARLDGQRRGHVIDTWTAAS